MRQKRGAGGSAETLSVWPETARILGLGRNATYRGIASGEIPSIRVGGRILVPRQQLLKMLGGAVRGRQAEADDGEASDRGSAA